MPSLVKILACFAAILILNRLRLPLSLSLFAGATALGLWSGLSAQELIGSAARGIWRGETLYLILMVVLILLLSRLWERSGQLRRMVAAFEGLVKDRRVVSAALPALIGLLPMPGGALFSAPMVESATSGHGLEESRKAVINYWFRHIWEYWWPLYPGFVMAVGLLSISMGRFMLIQMPLTLFAVAVGTAFFLRGWGSGVTSEEVKRERGHPLKVLRIKRAGPEKTLRGLGAGRRGDAQALFRETLPLIILVMSVLVLVLGGRLLEACGSRLNLPDGFPVIAGLLACLAWMIFANRLPASALTDGLRQKKIIEIIILVMGIMFLRAVMDGGGISRAVREELIAYGISPLLVIVALPFVSGLITGIAFGFVGSSFPVILPLLEGLPPDRYLVAASLAYCSGYLGMLLSPVHLCLLFSKDYFRAGFPSCYAFLLPAVILLLVIDAAYYLVLFTIF